MPPTSRTAKDDLTAPTVRVRPTVTRDSTGRADADSLDSAIAVAVDRLRRGGAVVLPTETVYGLAADARNPEAVARIFAIKGRPADHPLIVHIAGPSELPDWAAEVPAYARALIEEFWPGPLTIVLTRAPAVPDVVTGGQDTVALRCPDHPMALRVLREFGAGLAAPSANRFGGVSPTTAAHAREGLGDRLDADLDHILDGGPCAVGVESTIVDCTGSAPRVLRPGAIGSLEVRRAAAMVDPSGGIGAAETAAATAAVTGETGVSVPTDRSEPTPLTAPTDGPPQSRPRVPGALDRHYSPRAVVSLARSWRAAGVSGPAVGFIGPTGTEPDEDDAVTLLAAVDTGHYASALYAALRRADDLRLERVVAVAPTDSEPLAVAIRDRLARASSQP